LQGQEEERKEVVHPQWLVDMAGEQLVARVWGLGLRQLEAHRVLVVLVETHTLTRMGLRYKVVPHKVLKGLPQPLVEVHKEVGMQSHILLEVAVLVIMEAEEEQLHKVQVEVGQDISFLRARLPQHLQMVHGGPLLVEVLVVSLRILVILMDIMQILVMVEQEGLLRLLAKLEVLPIK